MTRGKNGFTLIEIAVALFVVVLLLGSLLVPLATQIEQRQVSDTQKTMEEIRDALTGFAVANGRLPCPDRTTGTGANDGVEDVVSGACDPLSGTVAIGNVPWSTLGVAPTDAWGNRYRYVVLAVFASTTVPFSLTTSGTLQICTTQACTALLTNSATAAIVSHGRNGYGAINAATGTANAAPAGADEIENTDSDANLVWHTPTALGSTAGEFDDLVVWLPRYTLLNRMVATGKLP